MAELTEYEAKVLEDEAESFQLGTGADACSEETDDEGDGAGDGEDVLLESELSSGGADKSRCSPRNGGAHSVGCGRKSLRRQHRA
jgi:hypothetical protein